MAFAGGEQYDVENRSLDGGGGFSGGTGGGLSDVGNRGVAPPKNITIASMNNGAQFLVTLTNGDIVANTRDKATWYRIYYLNAREVSSYNVTNAVPNPLVTPTTYPFQPGTGVTGKRHFVVDVPVATGNVTTVTVSSAPYLNGGWFYAIGVNSVGTEGGQLTNPVPLPIALSYSAPDTEVTNVLAPWAVVTYNGLKYAQFSFSWKTNTGAVLFPTKYVQIFISNYNNDGLLVEGPVFNTSTVGGATSTGTYLLECDDGTGGFPSPGVHAVTLYFVSLSASYSHRADPTGAPNVILATGVHS